jgi:ABC-type uncharacterized transport system permease subunit
MSMSFIPDHSMVGALNKLPIAISGIIFLPSEKNASFLNVVSIFIGEIIVCIFFAFLHVFILAFVSGVVYSIAQLSLKKLAKSKQEPSDEKV